MYGDGVLLSSKLMEKAEGKKGRKGPCFPSMEEVLKSLEGNKSTKQLAPQS